MSRIGKLPVKIPEKVKVVRPDDSRQARGLHGLTRTLVRNAVDGVTKGY
jgi:large subunit ribosomal protein L6